MTSIGIDDPEVVSIYLGSKTIAGVCISSTVMYPDNTLVSEPPSPTTDNVTSKFPAVV